MRQKVIVICVLGLIGLFGAAPASAQRTTATLAGLVVDNSGGALPGATVELVNMLNALNWTNYRTIQTSSTASNFGEVTGTANPRQIQLQVRFGF
jgi:hypothetical protein